jgi:predicted enzyme related to lactoylglutathione lyase
MAQSIKLFVYPVKDVTASKVLYSKLLGVEPYVDGAYYVGFRIGDLEIGLDPNAHRNGVTTPIGYVDVTDIKDSLQTLLDAGAQVQQEVKDVGGGLLIATVTDVDGNILGLRQSP